MPHRVPHIKTVAAQEILQLKVLHRQNYEKSSWGEPICVTDIWELWYSPDGRQVFFSPRQNPPRRVILEPELSRGMVELISPLPPTEALYPLQSIDIRIMVNWLVRFGDLILHAAGLVVDNQGVCFIGHSGAGKSTLVAEIVKTQAVTVLGEDQVILRYINGDFFIFGTPWHESSAMCAPMGVPLRKLYFLDRDAKPGLHPISGAAAVSLLLKTAFIPYYLPDCMHLIMDRLSLLIAQVPHSTLSYRLGMDVNTLFIAIQPEV